MIKQLLNLLLVIAIVFIFIPRSYSLLDENELQKVDELFLETLKNTQMNPEIVLQKYREILDEESNLDKGAWIISDRINLNGTPKGLWTNFKIDVRTDGIAANASESDVEIEINTPSTKIDNVVKNLQDKLNIAFEEDKQIIVSHKDGKLIKLEAISRNEETSIAAIGGIFGKDGKFGRGIDQEFRKARDLFKKALIESENKKGLGYIKPEMNPRDDPRFVDFGIAYGAFILAVDNNPESINVPYAIYRLGDILLEQSLLFESSERERRIKEDVIPAYEKALALYPQNIRGEYVLFWLGQFYYSRGNLVQAKDYYQRLVQNYQNQSKLKLVDNAQFMISDCELKFGNINRSQKILKELANKETVLGYEAILTLARLEPPDSNLQEPLYMETIRAGENELRSIDLIIDVANRLLNNREFDKAIYMWELGIKRLSNLGKKTYPETIWIGLSKSYIEKAKVERKAGQIEQADDNLNKSLESLNQLPPEEQLERSTLREVNLLLASIYYYKEDYERAIDKYESADKELALGFDNKYKLVRSYVETGFTEKAIDLLKEQIEYINSLRNKDKLQEHLDNTYRALVDVYLIKNDYESAKAVYEEIKDKKIKEEMGKILIALEKLSGLIDESK